MAVYNGDILTDFLIQFPFQVKDMHMLLKRKKNLTVSKIATSRMATASMGNLSRKLLDSIYTELTRGGRMWGGHHGLVYKVSCLLELDRKQRRRQRNT